MAFSYAPSAAPMSGISSAAPMAPTQRLNYGAPLQYRVDHGDQQNIDYGNQFPTEQKQNSSIDPQVVAKLMQQFMGSSGSGGASSGLLSQGSGASGLGGSGLIGSATGATSASSTGGA